MENKRDRMIVCGRYQEALQAVSSEESLMCFCPRMIRGLCLRYANGRISPEQFIQKRNEIARMMKIGSKEETRIRYQSAYTDILCQ